MKSEWEKLCEKFLFRFGKRVLGKDTGGMIAKLKNDRGVDAAWNALEAAADTADPREYVGAILRRREEIRPSLNQAEVERLWANYKAKIARTA